MSRALSSLRARVTPSSPQPLAPIQLFHCPVPALPEELREATSTPTRIGWASLLARVFAVDVTVCSLLTRRADRCARAQGTFTRGS